MYFKFVSTFVVMLVLQNDICQANLFNRLFGFKQPKASSIFSTQFSDTSFNQLVSGDADHESNKPPPTPTLMVTPAIVFAGNETNLVNGTTEPDNKFNFDSNVTYARWANKNKTDQLMLNYTLTLLDQLEAKINQLKAQLNQDPKASAGQWKLSSLDSLRTQIQSKRSSLQSMQNRPISIVERTMIFSTAFVTKTMINAFDLVLLTTRNPSSNSTTPTYKLS